MQKGVVCFEDLKEGMKVTGKIKNVVDFGAFVDLGIKETALLHISELSDSYVSDPMEVVRVGDIKECTIIGLDTDRRRISLSLKSSPVLHSASQNAKGSPAGENAADSVLSSILLAISWRLYFITSILALFGVVFLVIGIIGIVNAQRDRKSVV